MKEIIYDMIHMTQWEFILSHPIFVISEIIVIFVIGSILIYIQDKIQKKRNNKK